MELHQVKELLPSDETVTRLKRQPIEWEKIFGSYSSNKGTQKTQPPKNQHPNEEMDT
jgi:hypothetical protein